MDFSIRKAGAADNYLIADIIKDSMGYINSPALIKENLERIACMESELILIVEICGIAAGFIHARDYNSLYAPPLKDVISLAVKKEYQHMKIGTALMCEVEKWAAATGRKGVRVLSSSHWTDAHKFYQTLGYKNDKTQLNFHKYF
ncbi:MAG: GNAT family N-acetyltransferase [Oscillospiraceae bacterium]|nr:GNAT family N-acetyltransferase [Oscillospiraceae bacterium]